MPDNASIADKLSIPDKMDFRDSAGRTWSKPIPEHVRIEMAACVALDQLGAALAQAKVIMAACDEACQAMVTESNAKLVHAKWAGKMADTTNAFQQVDISGQALIDAVRTMLNV